MSLMPIVAPFNDPPITVAEVSTNNVFPTVMDGDLGLLMQCHSVYGFATQDAVPLLATPPDFNLGYRQSTRYSRSGLWGRVSCAWNWRSLTADLTGTPIGSEALANTLLVFRHPRNTLVSFDFPPVAESTPSFNGAIQFGQQISPIIPIFYAHKFLFQPGTNILLPQPAPAILFDNAPVTYYDTSITGATLRIALLTGPQSPRSINVSLEAANPGANTQITRHLSLSVRRALIGG